MKIEPTSLLGEVMDSLPGARRALFAKYHLGGCQSCAFSMDETMAELASRESIEVAEMIAHLEESDRHDQEMLRSATEVAAALAGGALLLDTRTREEFDAVAIECATFFTQEKQQELFANRSEQAIYLIDHQGKNVLDLVSWFRGHGLTQAFGVRGGIDAWSREVDARIARYRIELD